MIYEVRAQASREATMERRRTFAAAIRRMLRNPELAASAPAIALAKELEALASELDDGQLALDPACAVACTRLLNENAESPLLNPAFPQDELRSRAAASTVCR